MELFFLLIAVQLGSFFLKLKQISGIDQVLENLQKGPKIFVLNELNDSHDVPNLFVMDGRAFVSQADKNPTWTILALAW